jgi:hypothetical protein
MSNQVDLNNNIVGLDHGVGHPCSLAATHTPFPQYGDALALDRGSGHVRDRRVCGTLCPEFDS